MEVGQIAVEPLPPILFCRREKTGPFWRPRQEARCTEVKVPDDLYHFEELHTGEDGREYDGVFVDAKLRPVHIEFDCLMKSGLIEYRLGKDALDEWSVELLQDCGLVYDG